MVKVGKIRYLGLSNETPWGIMNFIKIAKEKKLPIVVSVQNGYSLVNRLFDIANSEVSIRENVDCLFILQLQEGD